MAEVEYNEVQKAISRYREPEFDAVRRGAFLLDQMRKAFTDAEVVGYEGLIGTFGLPDPDDEHVVAAAVVAGAGAIVTENTRDFPQDRLPPNLQVLRPAEFARDTVSVDPLLALTALLNVSRRRSVNETDVLDLLVVRYRMAGAVDILREALSEAGPVDEPDPTPTRRARRGS